MDSQTLGIVAILVVALLVAIFALLRGKEHPDGASNRAAENGANPAVENQQLESVPRGQPLVRFEEAGPLDIEEERRLVEITDGNLLARIDATIPVVVQAGNVATIQSVSKAISAHNDAMDAAGPLYRAIIPKDATLANSRVVEGAKRGFYHGPDGINGHAIFVQANAKVDSGLGGALAASSAVNAAMSVGSMVVGQYYMAQIDSKLDSVTKGIDEISSFQDNEYKSKVYALVAQVQKSATFRVEIMEDEAVRLRELAFLKDCENECIQLLGQANITIDGYSKREEISFEEYENVTRKVEGWYQYQKVLLSVLQGITELTYVLNKGAVSRESCNNLYLIYERQSLDADHKLRLWHGYNVTNLELDASRTRRKRQGIDRAVMIVPGVFNDDLNYMRISGSTTKMIKGQMNGFERPIPIIEDEPYEQDVEIFAIEGKMYYLPEWSESEES